MNLTFHLIDKNWDKGKILNTKKFNVKNKSAIEICTLYKFNINFIQKNIKKVLQNKIKFLPTKYGKLNITPSYVEILQTFLSKK